MAKSAITINPALKGLEPLVGDWDMELSNARFLPNKTDKFTGSAKFEWVESGDFLAFRQGNKESDMPYSTSVIGRDEKKQDYVMLYLDNRGVSRVYMMSFKDGAWRQWRDQPGFYQRFEGKIGPDGKSINASWEFSKDGSNWEHDFDLIYRRK